MKFLTGALVLLMALLASVCGNTLRGHALDPSCFEVTASCKNSLQFCDKLNCITVGPGADSKDETDNEKECRNCHVESQACSNNPTETSLQCCDELELFCMKDPFVKTFLCISFSP